MRLLAVLLNALVVAAATNASLYGLVYLHGWLSSWLPYLLVFVLQIVALIGVGIGLGALLMLVVPPLLSQRLHPSDRERLASVGIVVFVCGGLFAPAAYGPYYEAVHGEVVEGGLVAEALGRSEGVYFRFAAPQLHVDRVKSRIVVHRSKNSETESVYDLAPLGDRGVTHPAVSLVWLKADDGDLPSQVESTTWFKRDRRSDDMTRDVAGLSGDRDVLSLWVIDSPQDDIYWRGLWWWILLGVSNLGLLAGVVFVFRAQESKPKQPKPEV